MLLSFYSTFSYYILIFSTFICYVQHLGTTYLYSFHFHGNQFHFACGVFFHMISYQINNIIHWIMTSSDKFKNFDGEYVTHAGEVCNI